MQFAIALGFVFLLSLRPQVVNDLQYAWEKRKADRYNKKMGRS